MANSKFCSRALQLNLISVLGDYKPHFYIFILYFRYSNQRFFRLTKLDGFLLHLPSLTHLDLSGNTLLTLSSVRLPALLQLDLSGNNLVELDDSITDSSAISMLNLSENPLIRLPNSLFKKLDHLKQFDVSKTEITSLPKIPTNMRLNDLNLEGVNLRCECDMLWMVKFFQQFSRHISALSQIECAMPSKYAGTKISLFAAPECDNFVALDENICQDMACNHGAKCVVENNEPKCQCHSSWGGENCEKLLIDLDLITEEPHFLSGGSKIWIKNATTNDATVRT